jgi:hypothetical protein
MSKRVLGRASAKATGSERVGRGKQSIVPSCARASGLPWPKPEYLQAQAGSHMVGFLSVRTERASAMWLRLGEKRVLMQRMPLSRLGLTRATLAALPLWMLVLWVLVFVLRVHWPFLRTPTEHNIDEGYLMAVGQRMLHGRMLPYVDGVAHGGPLFVASGALIAAFNEFSYLPIRVAAVSSFLANALLMAVAGRAAGFGLAGALATLGVPAFCIMRLRPIDGIAYNAEVVTNVWILASLASAVYGLRATNPRALRVWLAAAGACGAVGALSKQIGAPLTVPIALYIAAGVWGNSELSTRARLSAFGAFCAGGLVPVCTVLVWFGLKGGLKDFYYYLVTYNTDIYMVYANQIPRWPGYQAWASERAVELVLCATTATFGAAQFFRGFAEERRLLAAYNRHGFEITLSLLAVLSVFGARASMREFDHYYLLCVPWFSLLAGMIVERASGFTSLRRGAPGWAACCALLLCAPGMAVLEIGYSGRRTPYSLDSSTLLFGEVHEVAREPEVCKVIQAYTRPDQRLFVWGFHGQLYVACKRLPASRYVFTTFVAGLVPWFGHSSKEEEDLHAVPGSREILIRELEATKPPVIVDSSAYTLQGRAMRRYDELARYLDAHYREYGPVGPELVYLRKD